MENERKLSVELGDQRRYTIHIGNDMLAKADKLITDLLYRPKIAIISERRVAALHLARLQAAFANANIEVDVLVIEPGEQSKSWAELQHVVEWLLSVGVERNDMVLALGGGVIGDLVGFAASILRRGVRFIQAPTSLLAQVDSSVGGKTGINSPSGKNLIGAFHQPSRVICDISCLSTLSERDFLSGYGEVVKYGLLGDEAFFSWLEENAPRIKARDGEALADIVQRCCELKAGIVARDERESGERALLNLGHTFGHALEAATGYSHRLLHGEAVSIGCMMALRFSEELQLLPSGNAERLGKHLDDMGMRSSLEDIPGALPSAEEMIELMAQDKKVLAGKMRFILLHKIGTSFVASDVPEDALRSFLEAEFSSKLN